MTPGGTIRCPPPRYPLLFFNFKLIVLLVRSFRDTIFTVLLQLGCALFLFSSVLHRRKSGIYIVDLGIEEKR